MKGSHSGFCQVKWDQIIASKAFKGVKPSEGEGAFGMMRIELCEMEQNESLGILGLVVGTISSQGKL